MTDDLLTHDLLTQLRARTETKYAGQRQERLIPDILCQQAADEIERLRARCEAYKDQVEAGAAEIKRLRTENEHFRRELDLRF